MHNLDKSPWGFLNLLIQKNTLHDLMISEIVLGSTSHQNYIFIPFIMSYMYILYDSLVPGSQTELRIRFPH